MSGKPQREPAVSRETAGLSDAEIMLNKILDQAMPNVPDPPEEKPVETQKPPEPENVSRETPKPETSAPPPPEKNMRSSVYVYLAVLFGAAFLMLLLAYFVQQRNNATALDDLRSTNTASRKELLDDIQRLEEQNETLQQNNELLNIRLDQVKEERDKAKQDHQLTLNSLNNIMVSARIENILNWLEQFVSAGDWLISGTLVENYDSYFNEHNQYFISYSGLLPSQTARYLELRKEVFDKAGCMVMESSTTTEDWSEFKERPYIGQNIFEEQDLQAARALAAVLASYPTLPGNSAYYFDFNFQPNSENTKRLTGGAFTPFTAELLEQVKADLLAQNYLMEDEDGTLSKVIRDDENEGEYFVLG